VRGLALTPDNTQLAVADWGSENVFFLDPDMPNSTTAPPYVGVNVPGFGPALVAATNSQTVFVGLSPVSSTPGPCTGCLSQVDLATSQPTIETAPQPEVASIVGVPLLRSDAAGDRVLLAFDGAGPEALWAATAPNDFTTFPANESVTDIAAAGDGAMFATAVNGAAEIRDAALNLIGTRATPEIEQFPSGVTVPGIAMHPSGALVYQPFLDGPAPPETSTPAPNPTLRGGIDIFDAHSGRLRLRIFLPEPIAATSGDTDGLHAQFLTVDENGQRLFVITNSGLTVVQLANVPLAIGTLSSTSGPAAGGTSVTLRGSGFLAGTTATLGGKTVAVTYVDANTLTLTTPATTAGPQQLVLTNPDGETTSLDAAFTSQ
jgi:hypothetical protein